MLVFKLKITPEQNYPYVHGEHLIKQNSDELPNEIFKIAGSDVLKPAECRRYGGEAHPNFTM